MSEFSKSVIVKSPIERCYQQWTQLTDFPKFMHHIEAVHPTNEMNVWHWTARSPIGQKLEWDAKWDVNEPERRISWHTVDNQMITMHGNVGFAQLGDNETQVTVTFRLELPGGPIGDAVAALFSNPEHMVEEDLNNFKTLLESELMVPAY